MRRKAVFFSVYTSPDPYRYIVHSVIPSVFVSGNHCLQGAAFKVGQQLKLSNKVCWPPSAAVIKVRSSPQLHGYCPWFSPSGRTTQLASKIPDSALSELLSANRSVPRFSKNIFGNEWIRTAHINKCVQSIDKYWLLFVKCWQSSNDTSGYTCLFQNC